ncbi:MAG TPA: sigma 54-interacting transcriptional regulator, partial [Nitrospiria bacterium]|nr:sigma 54-interacting transcriptional regulator [Nitrospiria bacterium]
MKEKLTILMVTPEKSTSPAYNSVLGLEQVQVFFASGSSEAIKLLNGGCFDLMTYRITSLSYERLDKVIRFLRQAIEVHKKSILILSPSPSPAMEALMNHFNGFGQIDWIVGCPEEAALFRLYDRLISHYHALVSRETTLPTVEGPIFENMVGQSPVIIRVFNVIRSLALHSSVVLITGATGTGKELTARAIHNLSPRRSMRFVSCNCAAIPENLIESELYGHVNGAFTGASEERDGLFRYGSGGTIFLDEISEMPLALQAKLLRVVEDLNVRPVGSDKEEAIDVRIIAATNKDLWRMVQEGTFRKDLYYRLNVTEIVLPSLRDRPEDLRLLCDHFLDIVRRQYGLGPRRYSDEV